MEISYKTSVILYLSAISMDKPLPKEDLLKVLSMLEIASSTLTEEQWKAMYNISLW